MASASLHCMVRDMSARLTKRKKSHNHYMNIELGFVARLCVEKKKQEGNMIISTALNRDYYMLIHQFVYDWLPQSTDLMCSQFVSCGEAHDSTSLNNFNHFL
jgi:hypothetical protein